MTDFIVEETPHTPYVHFCATDGVMHITGRSIPDDPNDFWLPVLSWLESYVLNPNQKTVVQINLEYFDISSSKRILMFMYKLNELVEKGKDVQVEWYYRSEDEDMYEVGQDYAYMVKVPFVFKEFQDTDLLLLNEY